MVDDLSRDLEDIVDAIEKQDVQGRAGHVMKNDQALEKIEPEDSPRKMSPFGHVFRFLGWWLGFSGLYSMFAICPFCGQSGCPVGLASAGTVGAFFSLCIQDWKRFFSFLRQKVKGN